MEWRVSPANIILVASYQIDAYATRSHTQDAYWYQISITYDGKKFYYDFYGGQALVFNFTGTDIRVASVVPPGSRSIKPEPGVLAIPLDNPIVQEVVRFFKNLERPRSFQL